MRLIRGAGMLAVLALLGGAGGLQAQAPEPGIHPVLVLAGETPVEATVELHLQRVRVAEKVASFQGELRFDPARVRVAAARFPGGITGVWNAVAPGRIRFAAISPQGVERGPVLVLSLATSQPVTADSLQLTLQEVYGESFVDLSPRVRPPVLSRTPP